MTEDSIAGRLGNQWRARNRGLREEDLASVDPYVREALIENKRSGLLLAVRARWIALAITAVLIPFINPFWEAIYYEFALILFALIGWAQLRLGKVAQSRWELLLILCDLALATFLMIMPNPLRAETWPTAFQFQLSEFSYFYLFLAFGTLAYSWRTLYAFGAWTAVLWALGIAGVALFGTEIPELSEKAAIAFAGYDRILSVVDPNGLNFRERIQEIMVFLIITGILIVNGRRANELLFRQAGVARERANLARYFPPTIVDQMAERDQPLGDVRSQNVAAMFVDIVGFTRMAERQTPEETVALLREFHARLEAAVFEHGGTLDKFLGDGLMATFGTPEPGPDDAGNAMRCGRAMLDDIDRWNRDRERSGADPVRVSIGVHFGPVVLGDVGSARRLEYAVLGDTVNVASRLEALTRTLEVRMVVSDALIEALRREAGAGAETALVDLRQSGRQPLRGRDEPIGVWTL